MEKREQGRISYFLLGICLGAVGGLVSAMLTRKEMRDVVRDRSGKTFDFINQHAARLREAAEELARKGKEFVGPHPESVKTDMEAEKQAYEEDRRENLGG